MIRSMAAKETTLAGQQTKRGARRKLIRRSDFEWMARAVTCIGLVASFARSSSATELVPSCEGRQVTAEGHLDEEWIARLSDVCRDLSARADLDPTAKVSVIPADPGVVVDVSLADGRRTLRRVLRPSDLGMTIEALLALPTPEPTKTMKAPEPPDRRPNTTEGGVPSPAKKTIATQSPTVALELSLEMVGRAGGSQGYLGFGPVLHAAVRIGAWAVGIQGRWDAYERVTTGKYPGFEMDGLGVSFLVARTMVALPVFHLDLGLRAGFLSESQSYEATKEEEAGTVADARVGTLLRARIGEGPWRWLISTDAELSPLRLHRTRRIDAGLPALPSWGFGLGTGVEWSGQ